MDVGSISDLGARQGTFFLKEKGTLSENKKGTSFFMANSWGHVPPQCPLAPASTGCPTLIVPRLCGYCGGCGGAVNSIISCFTQLRRSSGYCGGAVEEL